jgi:hypothetical protein
MDFDDRGFRYLRDAGDILIRHFHRGLGVVLAALYVYWVTHQGAGLPKVGMTSGVGYQGKSGTGVLVAYGLPIAAMICFIWPERLMWWFSPRTPPEYDYLFTEGAWYVLGYFLLAVAIFVLLMFR